MVNPARHQKDGAARVPQHLVRHAAEQGTAKPLLPWVLIATMSESET